MKSRIFSLAIMCSLLISGNLYPNSIQEVIKIAPYGNSITQSNKTHQSYRYPLWKKLIDAKITFDFVGSMNTNYGGNPSQPNYNGRSFDYDHEGHWGWRADEILNSMGSWLTKYTPDMVLLHIGTNDCIQGQNNSTTVDEITKIVAKLRSDNPAVVIFLANLIPCSASGASSRVNDLNSKIKPLVGQLNTASSPVIFVDQNSGMTSKDQFDGIHPNASGEEKMAQKWFDAIKSYLTSTKSKNDNLFNNSQFSVKEPAAHSIKLVCSPIPQERAAALKTDGSITNLLGKSVFQYMRTGNKTNGVYIFSKHNNN